MLLQFEYHFFQVWFRKYCYNVAYSVLFLKDLFETSARNIFFIVSLVRPTIWQQRNASFFHNLKLPSSLQDPDRTSSFQHKPHPPSLSPDKKTKLLFVFKKSPLPQFFLIVCCRQVVVFSVFFFRWKREAIIRGHRQTVTCDYNEPKERALQRFFRDLRTKKQINPEWYFGSGVGIGRCRKNSYYETKGWNIWSLWKKNEILWS